MKIFFKADSNSTACTDHIFLTCSLLMNTWVGSTFQLPWTAMNGGVQRTLWNPVFHSSGYRARSGNAGFFSSCLIFWGTAATAPLYLPINSAQGVQSLHGRADTSRLLSFDSSRPNGCEVVAHCSDLHLPDYQWGERLLVCLLDSCTSSLEKCLFKTFCRFLNRVVCCFCCRVPYTFRY